MSVIEKYRAAIDELVADGGKVTVESVRDRAGGGSARDVSAAINAWKEETSGEIVLTARELALADAIAERLAVKLAGPSPTAALTPFLGSGITG